MKEIFFVIKVFVITIVVVLIMQLPYEGQSLETRAAHFFSGSGPLHLLQDKSKNFADQFLGLIKKTKKSVQEYLN